MKNRARIRAEIEKQIEIKKTEESEELVMAGYNVQKNHKVEKQSHAYEQRLILIPLWCACSRSR